MTADRPGQLNKPPCTKLMIERILIHGAKRKAVSLKIIPVCLLWFTLSWSPPAAAEEAEKAETSLALEYAVTIDPEKLQVAVIGKLRGHGGKMVRQFQSKGLKEKVKIGVSKAEDGAIVFRYDLPVRQAILPAWHITVLT